MSHNAVNPPRGCRVLENLLDREGRGRKKGERGVRVVGVVCVSCVWCVCCVCVCVCACVCVWTAVPGARAQRVRLVEIGLGLWEYAGAREGRCAPSAVRRAVGGDSLLGAASRARIGDRNIQVGASAVFTCRVASSSRLEKADSIGA